MTEAHPPEWTALLNRLGIRPAPATHKTDADRRVDRVLPRVSESAPDIEIALALLAAAASGPLRTTLGEIHAGSTAARAALVEQAGNAPTRRPRAFARALVRLGIRAAATTPAHELDARVRAETTAAITAAPESQLDRAAAIDGVRRLLARKRLSHDRVEGILRALRLPG